MCWVGRPSERTSGISSSSSRIGRVEDHPVLAAAQRPFAEAEVGQLGDLGQEVGLEDHLVEGDAEARQRLALPADHRRRASSTTVRAPPGRRPAPASSARRPCPRRAPTRGRPSPRRRRRRRRSRCGSARDVLGVTEADEVVALLAVLGAELIVGAAGGDDPRHRLAHAAADVADQAAVLDPGAADAERRGDRVAERQVAEVADVERLGRVGAPEVDGVAGVGGEVGVGVGGIGAGLERARRAPRSTRRRGRRRRRPWSRGPRRRPGRRRSARAPRAATGSAAQSRTRGTSIRSRSASGRKGERAAHGAAASLPPATTPSMLSKRFPAIAPSPRTLPVYGNAPAGARTRITGLQVRPFNRLRHWCWLCESAPRSLESHNIEFPDCSIRGGSITPVLKTASILTNRLQRTH